MKNGIYEILKIYVIVLNAILITGNIMFFVNYRNIDTSKFNFKGDNTSFFEQIGSDLAIIEWLLVIITGIWPNVLYYVSGMDKIVISKYSNSN